MNGEKIIKIIGTAATVGAFGVLVWLENRRPLRRSVESKIVRNGRNLAVAGLSGIALRLFENPVVQPLTRLVDRRNLSLLKIRRLPPVLAASNRSRFLKISISSSGCETRARS